MTYVLLLVLSISALYSMNERDLDLAKKLQNLPLEMKPEEGLDFHKELKKMCVGDIKEDEQAISTHGLPSMNQTPEDLIINQMIDEKCKKMKETEELQKKLLLKRKNPGDKLEYIMAGTKKVYEENTKNFIATFVSRIKEDFDNNHSYTQFLKKDILKNNLPFIWQLDHQKDSFLIFSTVALLNDDYGKEKLHDIAQEYKNHFNNEYAKIFKKTYLHWAGVQVKDAFNKKTQQKGLQFSVVYEEITEEIAEKKLQNNQEIFESKMLALILLAGLHDPKVHEEMQSEKFKNFIKECSEEEKK